MPQLMPLLWLMSCFMIILVVMVMVDLFFNKMDDLEVDIIILNSYNSYSW